MDLLLGLLIVLFSRYFYCCFSFDLFGGAFGFRLLLVCFDVLLLLIVLICLDFRIWGMFTCYSR